MHLGFNRGPHRSCNCPPHRKGNRIPKGTHFRSHGKAREIPFLRQTLQALGFCEVPCRPVTEEAGSIGRPNTIVRKPASARSLIGWSIIFAPFTDTAGGENSPRPFRI